MRDYLKEVDVLQDTKAVFQDSVKEFGEAVFEEYQEEICEKLGDVEFVGATLPRFKDGRIKLELRHSYIRGRVSWVVIECTFNLHTFEVEACTFR